LEGGNSRGEKKHGSEEKAAIDTELIARLRKKIGTSRCLKGRMKANSKKKRGVLVLKKKGKKSDAPGFENEKKKIAKKTPNLQGKKDLSEEGICWQPVLAEVLEAERGVRSGKGNWSEKKSLSQKGGKKRSAA